MNFYFVDFNLIFISIQLSEKRWTLRVNQNYNVEWFLLWFVDLIRACSLQYIEIIPTRFC